MYTQYAQMEVLLITGTTFLSQGLCGKDDSDRGSHLSASEQLEKACWDGLFASILPEVFDRPDRDNHLYLWEVKSAGSFLQLGLGEAPVPVDSQFSINPYSFLFTQHCN